LGKGFLAAAGDPVDDSFEKGGIRRVSVGGVPVFFLLRSGSCERALEFEMMVELSAVFAKTVCDFAAFASSVAAPDALSPLGAESLVAFFTFRSSARTCVDFGKSSDGSMFRDSTTSSVELDRFCDHQTPKPPPARRRQTNKHRTSKTSLDNPAGVFDIDSQSLSGGFAGARYGRARGYAFDVFLDFIFHPRNPWRFLIEFFTSSHPSTETVAWTYC
jgi:hypothetical protein